VSKISGVGKIFHRLNVVVGLVGSVVVAALCCEYSTCGCFLSAV
jgi:hypothetical protein